MKTKEIIILTGFFGFMTMFIMIWQGIEDIILAIVTFLIVVCLIYLTFHEGGK